MRKLQSKALAISLFGLVIVSLFATSLFASPKWELKHATYATAEHPYSKVAQGFADQIFKATNGEVKITLFPNGALCTGADQFTSTVMGVADVTDLLSDYLVGQIDVLGLPSVPMSINSDKSGEIGEDARELLSKRLLDENLIYLYTYDYLPNVLFLKEKFASLSDMKGLKVRASGIYPIEMLKGVGMVPIRMSTSDIYMSVETKLIEGATTGALSWRSNKLNDLLPFIYKTPVPCVGFVVMNKDVFESFPENIQKTVIEEAKKYSVVANKLIHDAVELLYKEAVEELGCTIVEWSESDKEIWREEGIRIRNEYLGKSSKEALAFWEIMQKYPIDF